MDTVLARSVCVRPENKIVMKCPSWPDTPLHQYFGAKKSRQRKSDFAVSSLGYVRLYEYCCPCELDSGSGHDSDSGSSFVHLEERLRGDGPFILYRRPPQRRLGLGLSERARERRLLKYYKYFQGFQRKFQVSRQFQQAYQKPENKAKVKKIINCYKPKKTAQEQSSRKLQKCKQTNPASASNSRYVGESSRSVDESSQSTDENCRSVDQTIRSVDESTVPEKENKNVAVANTDNKKNTQKKVNKTQSSIQKELAEMAAVLASMGTNMNLFLKKADRGTLKTPTLATIQEVTGDCDVSEHEHSSETAPSSTPRVSINPDLPKKNQPQETRTLHTPSTFSNNKHAQIRGILKHQKKTPPTSTLKEPDAPETTPKLTISCEKASSLDSDTPGQTPQIRKFRRTRKTSVNVGTSGDDVSFAGGLKVAENVSLKKEVLPKARRFRPVLKRASDPSSRLQSGTSVSEKTGQSVSTSDVSDAIDQLLLAPAERTAPQAGFKDSAGPSMAPKPSFNPQKKRSKAISRQLPPGNIIKFSGWDFGTSLGGHALEKVPEDKDLCLQHLERAEKLRWGKYPMAFDQMSGPAPGKCETEKPDAYLQRQNIPQIFEHLARSLVVERSDHPLAGLQALAHDLKTQHANMQAMQRDLKDMQEKPKPSACSRYTDTSVNLIVSTLATKPRKRVGSILRRLGSPMVVRAPDDSVQEDARSNGSHD